MKYVLGFLILVCTFEARAELTKIETFSNFSGENEIKAYFGDKGSNGVISSDSEYFQSKGDMSTFIEALLKHKVKKATLHDLTVEQNIEFVVPTHLKELTIDGSNFQSGLSITANDINNLVIRGSEISGNFSIYEIKEGTNADLSIIRSKFHKADNGEGLFDLMEFYGKQFHMLDNEFNVEVSLIDLDPSRRSWIQDNKFNDGITLGMNTVKGEFLLLFNEIKGISTFSVDRFDSEARFNSTFFDGEIIMENIVFTKRPYFTRTRFKGSLDLAASNFVEGVDLRVAKFEKGTKVQFEAFEGDMSKFQIDLSQIENLDLHFTAPNKLLESEQERKQEELARLDKVYEQLKQSFKARGLMSEYDAISLIHYRKQNEIKKSIFSYLYDFFMAYGYQTWRFVLFIVAPSVVIFSVVYTRGYDREIREIVRRKDQAPEEQIYDPSLFASIARTIALSSSILFAIRYKTIWLTENHSFNKLVMFNYLYGIFLYLLFALGTRVSSFDIVKSMIGI